MTVAIIAEYNPFHNGHLYQIRKIREEFGMDTDIIAIMSGNYTQRGEPAIADKYLRAEWACLSGVNLVLELPFPYSMSSAEIFARSAVKIINSIDIVDTLSFGSENGDLNELIEVAENMLSEKYTSLFSKLAQEEKNLGHAALSEMTYKRAFNSAIPDDFFSPNNILAIEYIKAAKESSAKFAPHTVKRHGAAYRDEKISDHENQSAMAIRASLRNSSSYDAVKFLPTEVADSFKRALDAGEFPVNQDKLSAAVISHFALSPDQSESDIFDMGGGLYHRIKNASREAADLNSLYTNSETKKFTNARIKRAVWYSFFGVTSSKIKELPSFTHVLALDNRGRALLKAIKEKDGFPVITKPSSSEALNESAALQKKLSDKADAVFQLTKPSGAVCADALRKTPFVK